MLLKYTAVQRKKVSKQQTYVHSSKLKVFGYSTSRSVGRPTTERVQPFECTVRYTVKVVDIRTTRHYCSSWFSMQNKHLYGKICKKLYRKSRFLYSKSRYTVIQQKQVAIQ